jgi:hypothetical protein
VVFVGRTARALSGRKIISFVVQSSSSIVEQDCWSHCQLELGRPLILSRRGLIIFRNNCNNLIAAFWATLSTKHPCSCLVQRHPGVLHCQSIARSAFSMLPSSYEKMQTVRIL